MLGKLLKHDYRSSVFYFLLIYGVLLGIAVVARISLAMVDLDYAAFHDDVLSVMTAVGAVALYLISCGAAMVLTFLLIAMRFYKNLMGNEGYLSFTLPVTTGNHLASKLISGITWLVAGYVMIALSGLIMTAGTGLWSPSFFNFVKKVLDALEFYNPLIAVLYILEGIAGVLQSVLLIYFSICVGQLAGKHRVLAAFGIFIACILLLGIISALGSAIFANLLEDSSGTALYYGITKTAGLFYRLLVSVGCFVGAYYIMKEKLNLE